MNLKLFTEYSFWPYAWWPILCVFLDSEQNDKIIDFTVIIFFFFCLSSPFGTIKILQVSNFEDGGKCKY